MNEFYKRLLVEEEQLKEKIVKLRSFLNSERIQNIPIIQRSLMEKQCIAMEQYYGFLVARIKDLNDKPTTLENDFIKLCNSKFGKDLDSRIVKFDEEVDELFEAYNAYKQIDLESIENRLMIIEHLMDEISDVQAVLTHIASLIGLNFNACLEMANDKIEKRETDPNYKRFKQ